LLLHLKKPSMQHPAGSGADNRHQRHRNRDKTNPSGAVKPENDRSIQERSLAGITVCSAIVR
jgi:hypothetical protein